MISTSLFLHKVIGDTPVPTVTMWVNITFITFFNAIQLSFWKLPFAFFSRCLEKWVDRSVSYLRWVCLAEVQFSSILNQSAIYEKFYFMKIRFNKMSRLVISCVRCFRRKIQWKFLFFFKYGLIVMKTGKLYWGFTIPMVLHCEECQVAYICLTIICSLKKGKHRHGKKQDIFTSSVVIQLRGCDWSHTVWK